MKYTDSDDNFTEHINSKYRLEDDGTVPTDVHKADATNNHLYLRLMSTYCWQYFYLSEIIK